jgi:hypothetical protein
MGISMKDKIFVGVLSIICACSVFISYLCYSRLSDYDNHIQSLAKRLDETQSRWMGLNDEDLILLRRFDEVNKRFKEVDQKIKVNDIRITELGAKITRKK